MFKSIFKPTHKKHQILAQGFVMTDKKRCVQCGICSYNCPAGIDVRFHAFKGKPVQDSRCLTCGECIKRCPRSVLHFEVNQALLEEQSN
jgi:heterodisulfide reductase subunit C